MIHHRLFRRRYCEKRISDEDWTWLEYNLGWNVGEQAQTSQQTLGPKLVVNLVLDISVIFLYIDVGDFELCWEYGYAHLFFSA